MKKILLVVDYQKDFVDGSLGFDGAEALDSGIAEQVRKFRRNKEEILVTLDTHRENYLKTQEGRYLPIEHCILGTEGHKLFGETAKEILKAQEDCLVYLFYKDTFGSIDLLNHLKELKDIEEIHIVGLVSNICVLSNAIICKTALPEAKIVIHEDLINSYDEETHYRTLEIMRGLQMEIV